MHSDIIPTTRLRSSFPTLNLTDNFVIFCITDKIKLHRFPTFFSVSVRFQPFLSVSIRFSPFQSVSVRFYPFQCSQLPPYCCDESHDLYERYFDRQQKGKGDFPVYVGRHLQREHGIGSMLSSLFRRIILTFKGIAPHVLRAGVNMIEDVTSGKKWKDAAIKRVAEALKRIRSPDKPAATATLSTAANLLENTLKKYLTKPNE
jgi:hypothetical protein